MDKKLYKMMDWARVEQIVYSEEDDPHGYLGAHFVKGGWMISCFIPQADKVSVICNDKEYKMDMMDEEGFFSVLVRAITKTKINYRFKVTKGKETYIVHDPYRFRSAIDQKTLREFGAGICYDIYEHLGAHV
ncbi:MAG: 1,4-alpha-glucan branching enzyme, partial [Lachnospiraceae bacterium]|nr:1,4-alpha-glucan branching enzyme [Lachnospiraceae bacterium]